MLFSREDLKRLLIPLLLEQLLAVLIGIMDTVMVASCGEAAVSGVSLVDSINVLLIAVFSALATGGAVLASQYLGKQDRDNAGRAAKMLFYVVLICSVALMAGCLLLRDPLLSGIFGAIEADVMRNAQIYFLLSALSYPFLAMYNASAALLRSMGNAKATLKVSLAMNIINVAGNALTIYGLGWSVFGAGLSTLLSRVIGAVAAQYALRDPRASIPYPHLLQLEWNGGQVRKILTVGVPSGLENAFFQLGKLVLVRLISTFGTAHIAANAVCSSISTFHCLPGNAIGLAMITVVGQCVGARKFDQARYYTRRLMLLTYACMSSLNLLLLLLTPWMVSLFNLSAEATRLAITCVCIHCTGCIVLWPMSFTFPNALRAAGDAKYTMAVSAFSMVTFRVVFGYILAKGLGLGVVGVWSAMEIDWVFRITMFVLRYRSGRWESKVLV
ncbi:MAG: MATE family efflux transporter [Aristaeellaceae bacterium]